MPADVSFNNNKAPITPREGSEIKIQQSWYANRFFWPVVISLENNTSFNKATISKLALNHRRSNPVLLDERIQPVHHALEGGRVALFHEHCVEQVRRTDAAEEVLDARLTLVGQMAHLQLQQQPLALAEQAQQVAAVKGEVDARETDHCHDEHAKAFAEAPGCLQLNGVELVSAGQQRQLDDHLERQKTAEKFYIKFQKMKFYAFPDSIHRFNKF